MGDIGAISDLVKGMCSSVGVQPHLSGPSHPPGSAAAATPSGAIERNQTDFRDADATLAKLLWLGYPHEKASEAMRVSGSVDPGFLSDYIINHSDDASSGSEPTAVRSNGFKETGNDRSSRPQAAILRICEPDEERPRPVLMPANGSSRVIDGKGKALMDEMVEEDGEPEDDRWDVSNADTTLEILVEMGFTPDKVEEAIRAHGITGNILESVSSLANYIVTGLNNLNLDQDHPDDRNGQVGDENALALVIKDSLPHQDLEIFKQVTAMGFDAVEVSKAIGICGEAATGDQIVDHIFQSDASEKVEIIPKVEPVEDNSISSKFDQLLNMGYSYVNCRRAVDTYGQASICELCDFLDALGEEDKNQDLDALIVARSGKSSSDSDDESMENGKEGFDYFPPIKKRRTGKIKNTRTSKDKRLCVSYGSSISRNEDLIRRNRTGFGLPGDIVITRTLPPDVGRPPYFYFENVENMPSGEWSNIQRHLFNIEPELMDALNFSVCRRPRGYVHNLPVEGRMDILPKPPMTIQELMGSAAKYWPDWDKRVKLNTICTRSATDFVWRQIKDHLQACEKRGHPLDEEKKNIMYWARKWNLVWVRPNKLAPLSPEEVEKCLGFDVNHTRVLYSPVDRIKVLGNSFQVNTVAYQLSVLKARYPQGMRVLSLFSGIGGAEVALHKLGIILKVVVSIEIDEKARSVLDSWWKSTDQKGHLIHDHTDVKLFDSRVLMGLLNKYKGFDLVIGGSPCNNLSGNNRSSRVGLQGTESVAFFEFPRILNVVRDFMSDMDEELDLDFSGLLGQNNV
ncbi:protein MpDRMa [Marchantia polymorpha subsp. ruderalis]|uniref:DNA (cytosine-5-)-methyltransferase n=4 Tax=Marchantia polymorpha TaxID=3197 RepID=A0AAF6AJX3_MARPO|nr:hypothetical protein MARPO_0103s0053 [Marchantia polymorpha]BBM96743.1 hypothetical protein Mp_1g00340 [Marchantia polymorpha subsp. ruderalis]|eukprot:PTQ32082.1 hypothetical protein MARPO_0103s0053 [Marchantia polymorpha]